MLCKGPKYGGHRSQSAVEWWRSADVGLRTNEKPYHRRAAMPSDTKGGDEAKEAQKDQDKDKDVIDEE